MRRFLVDCPSGAFPPVGSRLALDAEATHHLLHVLRAEPGAGVALTDGRGTAAVGRLVGREGKAAVVEVTAVDAAPDETAPPHLVLACAVVKGKRFEFALEKAVELGAHRIVPVVTERGVVDPRAGKQDRWRGLLTAALKQCGRCWLPELAAVSSLDDLLTTAVGPVFFGAAPGDLVAERPVAMVTAAAQAARRRDQGQAPPGRLVLAIGPEGGWTGAELARLAAARAVPLNLGPHVLRTETAAVAGLVALQAVRGGWLAGG